MINDTLTNIKALKMMSSLQQAPQTVSILHWQFESTPGNTC